MDAIVYEIVRHHTKYTSCADGLDRRGPVSRDGHTLADTDRARMGQNRDGSPDGDETPACADRDRDSADAQRPTG